MLCLCLWCRWCFGRRRARPPARLGVLTSFGAAPRSPPVPSGPSGALHTGGACGSGVPGQAPPPPTGTAADLSGALLTGGACGSGVPGQAPPPPTGTAADPSGASSLVAPVVLVCPARISRPRASQPALTNFARNSPVTVSNLECVSLELQRFQRLLKLPSNELRATFLGFADSCVPHQRIQDCCVFRGLTVCCGCARWCHSWRVRTSL